MPLPESVRQLIDAARTRLTLAWVLSATVTAAAISGAAAALLLGVARYRVIVWAEPVAWALVVLAVVASLLVAVIRRPSRQRAALEVDRRLGGYDRISTALELSGREGAASTAEERAVRSAEI